MNIDAARETIEHFREWYADHFEEFSGEVNDQLWHLEVEARIALGLDDDEEED